MAERIQYELRGARTVYTLLSLAADGRTEDVREMVAAGVDVNVTDYDKRSALHLAASEGKVDTVEALIDLGADVNAVDRFGGTALRDALEGGRADIAAILRQHGGTLGEKTDVLVQKVCHAASIGNVVLLENVYENSFLSVNAADYDFRTPLHVAAGGGHKEAAEYLLRKGADARAKDRFGNTPIDEAAREGHQELSDFIASYRIESPHRPHVLDEEPVFEGYTLLQRRFLRCVAVYIHSFIAHKREEGEKFVDLKAFFSVDHLMEHLASHRDVILTAFSLFERRFGGGSDVVELRDDDYAALRDCVRGCAEEHHAVLGCVEAFVRGVSATSFFRGEGEGEGEGVSVVFCPDVLLNSVAMAAMSGRRKLPYEFVFSFT